MVTRLRILNRVLRPAVALGLGLLLVAVMLAGFQPLRTAAATPAPVGDVTFAAPAAQASVNWVVKNLTANASYAQLALEKISGNPAAVFHSNFPPRLKYARALNALGSSWGAPVVIDPNSDAAGEVSLQTVNGNPAISYSDSIGQYHLHYVRASDPAGLVWGTPITVVNGAPYDGGLLNSLAVVNGRPAIAYEYYAGDDLYYVRANNANGTSWSSPVAVDTSTTAVVDLSMVVVAGQPAIATCTGGTILYTRALNPDGTAWGAPTLLQALDVNCSSVVLQLVNNRPAVVFNEGDSVLYKQAADATGASWQAAQMIAYDGHNPDLMMMDDAPAVSYNAASSNDVYFVKALDADGNTWDTADLVESNPGTGSYTAIINLGGTPGVGYVADLNPGAAVRFAYLPQQFKLDTAAESALANLADGSTAWGDYDNDGDLDLVIAGLDGETPRTLLYRNDGGSLVEQGTALIGVHQGSLAWGDYDNDMDLDLLVTGNTDGGGPVRQIIVPNNTSTIYRNDGGDLVDAGIALEGVYDGSGTWADYDNDGDLDVLLNGTNFSGSATRLYQNTAGAFSLQTTALPDISGKAVWIDADQDGDLDLFLTGFDGGTLNFASNLYRNDGGSFSPVGVSTFSSYVDPAVTWADFDMDGDPDLALSGDAGNSMEISFYRNEGSDFGFEGVLTPGVTRGDLAAGDYDNDGDPDLLATGFNGSAGSTRLYKNNGGWSFVQSGALLPGVEDSTASWADYDNDGDLDLLVSGLLPVILPPEPITRWQGTISGIGLAPTAAPTARDACGIPIRWAISP